VLVADGQPIARAGVTAAISREPDLSLVASVADGGQALERIRELAPTVALLDVEMPGLSGLQVLEAVGGEHLRSRVLLIAAESAGADVHDAMVAGAAGYLTKQEPLDVVSEAIRAAAGGRQYLSPASQAALVEHIRIGGRRQTLLSMRELDILRLTAEGITSAGIGHRLHLSQSTVKNHQQNLYGKLGVHNAPAAIYQAMRRGLLR
jgi:two-component system nitrate/nitrite response regulator NarL